MREIESEGLYWDGAVVGDRRGKLSGRLVRRRLFGRVYQKGERDLVKCSHRGPTRGFGGDDGGGDGLFGALLEGWRAGLEGEGDEGSGGLD